MHLTLQKSSCVTWRFRCTPANSFGLLPPSACSQIIMIVGIAFCAVWYVIVVPCGLIDISKSQVDIEEEGGLVCRWGVIFPGIPFFRSWRSYGCIHVVLWMLKDYSWNTENKILWFASTIPTVLIGFDFLYTTAIAGESYCCQRHVLWLACAPASRGSHALAMLPSYPENMIIDHAHYLAEFLWVRANDTHYF